jgi:hypothetical protein
MYRRSRPGPNFVAAEYQARSHGPGWQVYRHATRPVDGREIFCRSQQHHQHGSHEDHGTGYLGYNPEDKVYTYHEFSSDGETVDARGTVDGDTWTWTSEEKMQGKVMKGRFIEKITSPTS